MAANCVVTADAGNLDSLTAWLVFVLYAGPVASLFPAFQEQAITRSAEDYARLRRERKAMYRFIQPLLSLQKLVRENPELTNIAKAAIQLRAHTEAETREALLTNPDLVRALASCPAVVDMMKQLGAPIPNLEELIQELPPPPADQPAPAEGRSETDGHTAHEEKSSGDKPATNNQERVQLLTNGIQPSNGGTSAE
jgi:hypothetical protein